MRRDLISVWLRLEILGFALTLALGWSRWHPVLLVEIHRDHEKVLGFCLGSPFRLPPKEPKQ